MATYAIGDIQGCYQPLCCLMEKIDFSPPRDTLWLVGDLVNRGPESAAVVRLAKSLGEHAQIVLGNHDLHLLAMAYAVRKTKAKDTASDILRAEDRTELIDWLRQQPLIHTDHRLGYTMVHAGIPPMWSLTKAHQLAAEVESALQSDEVSTFLAAMYGGEPSCWYDGLSGAERLRTITNYFTRMRFCTRSGELDFEDTDSTISDRPGFAPWFAFGNDALDGQHIVFGHWAALEGESGSQRFHALDTGCVWGARLTAMRLEDGQRFHCSCPDNPLSGSKRPAG